MTRAEIRQRILHGLNESTTAPVFWTAAEIDAVIDEAAEVMCEEAQAIKRTVFVPLRPGTSHYSLRGLGATLMSPYRLWLHGSDRRLGAVTMRMLDERHETWPTVTGDPWHWFPVSWDTFGIWPKAVNGGGVLRVDCLAWPRALQHDDDEPELLLGDHDALVSYGLYDGSAKRWDTATMLAAWSRFRAQIGVATERSGPARMQARDYQRGEGEGFTSGVTGFDR